MLNKNKFEKVLARTINKNSSRCSMCKRPFSGPCHTFGGFDADGKVQNVGQCCRSNIVDLLHGGVYITTSVGTEEGERQARDLMASHPLSRRMM